MLQLKWQLVLADLLQELSQLIPEVSGIFARATRAGFSFIYYILYTFFCQVFGYQKNSDQRSAVGGQRSAVRKIDHKLTVYGTEDNCLKRDLRDL